MPDDDRSGTSALSFSRAATKSSIPRPVTAETGTMGWPSRKVPRTNSRMSSTTSSSHSSSTMVDLGEDHHAVFDPEEGADFHVLPRLGHDALVGGDDHGHDVDARGPGHHVLDELLVTGNVDDAHVPSAGQVKGRKPRARW